MRPEEKLGRELPRYREELFDFLRIPSISAQPSHQDDVRRAAAWIREDLERTGFAAELVETEGHPVVLGEWRGAGPEAPTLLIYGHYDVQPPEPLPEWDSPPFEPSLRNGRIHARGATDDKGQVFLHLKALEAMLRDGGSLPVNVVTLFEGEEEVGSVHLLPVVERLRDRLACDAVVISDSNMYAPGIPSLLLSLRGLAYFELRVRGPARDLHSGTYGGAVVNPAGALARILSSLHDDRGQIAVPGLYDDVVEWDEETRDAIRTLPFDEAAYRRECGAEALGGEEGFSTLERSWIRPACDVNGIASGYTGEGAKTVLPATAMAKVSFRLVPDQDPERVGQLFRRHVANVAPPGVRVEVVELHGGHPWRARPEGAFFEAARSALRQGFGELPVLTGEGGSIPIVPAFEEVLGAQVVLLGFGLPGSNMHAPNEWFPEAHVEKGIRTLIHFYREAGKAPLRGPRGKDPAPRS